MATATVPATNTKSSKFITDLDNGLGFDDIYAGQMSMAAAAPLRSPDIDSTAIKAATTVNPNPTAVLSGKDLLEAYRAGENQGAAIGRGEAPTRVVRVPGAAPATQSSGLLGGSSTRIIIAVVLIGAGGYYYLTQRNKKGKK